MQSAATLGGLKKAYVTKDPVRNKIHFKLFKRYLQLAGTMVTYRYGMWYPSSDSSFLKAFISLFSPYSFT